MKKNIRFVSAAAAALLAVAPVVASTATANAAVTVNNATASQTTVPAANQLTVNVSLDATGGKTTVAEAIKSMKVTADGATVSGYNADNVSIVKNGTTTALKSTDVLEAGDYQVVIKDLALTGLTTGSSKYTVAGGTFAGDSATTPYSAKDLANPSTFTTDSFQINDSSLTGTPYFQTKEAVNGIAANTVVTSGAVSVATTSSNTATVDNVVTAINKYYEAAIENGSSAKVSQPDVATAVKSALSAAGVTVSSNGSFTVPSSKVFTVNLTATATNGKSVTLPIIVSFNNDAVDATYPVISYEGTKIPAGQTSVTLKSNASFNYITPGSSVDTAAIKKAFTAVVSSTDDTNLQVSVDTSKVNTAVAGTYPVTVSAKNPAGKTTSVTFQLTVGAKDATYQTVKTADNIYTVNGNKATQTDNTVSKGQNIATFGTTTIDGVEYTRINSADSNQFVQSSVFTTETGVDKTVMHAAQYYDKNGAKTTLNGKSIASSYSTVSVVATPVTINGKSYYKIANENAYVKASNIDGTKRTLKHNAYVYATSKKRATKEVLKKGDTVTTYGGSYTFKNGKKYYRIEGATASNKRYVKVANFE